MGLLSGSLAEKQIYGEGSFSILFPWPLASNEMEKRGRSRKQREVGGGWIKTEKGGEDWKP